MITKKDIKKAKSFIGKNVKDANGDPVVVRDWEIRNELKTEIRNLESRKYGGGCYDADIIEKYIRVDTKEDFIWLLDEKGNVHKLNNVGEWNFKDHMKTHLKVGSIVVPNHVDCDDDNHPYVVVAVPDYNKEMKYNFVRLEPLCGIRKFQVANWTMWKDSLDDLINSMDDSEITIIG